MEKLNLESTDIAAAGSRHVAEMLLENINITHIVGILEQHWIVLLIAYMHKIFLTPFTP